MLLSSRSTAGIATAVIGSLTRLFTYQSFNNNNGRWYTNIPTTSAAETNNSDTTANGNQTAISSNKHPDRSRKGLTEETTNDKLNVWGMTCAEITDVLIEKQQPKYRGAQIWNWLYQHNAKSFDDMSNLPKDLRALLPEIFTMDLGDVAKYSRSVDGTLKWLIDTAQKKRDTESDQSSSSESDKSKKSPAKKRQGAFEMVYIPSSPHGTLCISSQVGCSLTCSFCATGNLIPKSELRNLATHEIVGQVIRAKTSPEIVEKSLPLSNIVLMGMGEPLYNFKNVEKAIKIITDPHGIQFSKKKITLSTSGVTPLIPKIAELGVNLAISLHAPTNDLRDVLVPLNKTYNLTDLMTACELYANLTSEKKSVITFEYVMLKGVNDSLSHAKDLAKLIRHLQCKVNLIPFNSWAGSKYQCSSQKTMEDFQNFLQGKQIFTTIRKSRGDDQMAACGQLAGRLTSSLPLEK